jgi:hypothetical protein
MKDRQQIAGGLFIIALLTAQGCTVKAVGDPNRPITINAHITIDVKGLHKTANNIEDYVSGGTATPPATTQNNVQQGGK